MRLKKFLITFGCCLLLTQSFAQFPFDQKEITDGNINCTFITTTTKTVDSKIVSKTRTSRVFSSAIKIVFLKDDSALRLYNFKKYPQKRLPNLAIADNFSRTLDELETKGLAKVPRFPVSLSFAETTYGLDPCDRSDNPKLIEISNGKVQGTVENENAMVNVQIASIENEKADYILKVLAGSGGSGEKRDLNFTGNIFKPDPDPNQPGTCRWFKIPSGCRLFGPMTSEIFLYGSEIPTTFTRTGPGNYERIQPETEYESERITRYQLLKLDTGQLFEYVRNRKNIPFKTFNFSGAYQNQISNKSTKVVEQTTEECQVVLNIGTFQNDLLISTSDKDDYHSWLPQAQECSGYKDLLVKVLLQSKDDNPKDTLELTLNGISRNPGICNNYPKPEKGKTSDTHADIWFKSAQSDPNVMVIDSFHVKSRITLTEINVDIVCNDYGAYAQLKARAVNKMLDGYNGYDNGKGLRLPEDLNRNFIADKWEKDVGIFNNSLPPRDDSDILPEFKSGDNGDGFSLYEEYRGFYSERDFCKKPDNVIRNGEHIRTDPNYKDIFVFDDTKTVFEKYFAFFNPANLNWHLLSDKQVINYSSSVIKSKLKASKGLTTEFAKELNQFDNRLVNYNSGSNFQLAKHYSLYLLYSSIIDGTASAGQALTFEGNPQRTTPIGKTELVTFQHEEPFYTYIREHCPYKITCSKFPTCDFNVDGMKPFYECPQCGSLTKCVKFFTLDEENTISENQYLAAIIHEIGHGIGIGHHTNGVGRIKESKDNYIHVTKAVVESIRLQYGESSDEYKMYDDALCACGMANCALKYGFQELKEFTTRQVLNVKQTTYCQKGNAYYDLFGDQHPSDDCYSKIIVK